MSIIAYFIFLALALGAFFCVRRFLKADALRMLAVTMFVLALFPFDLSLFNYAISMNVVFTPILFLCMLFIYKQDPDKARRYFYRMLIVVGAVFLANFIQSVMFACQGFGAITWDMMGGYVALGVSLTTAMFAGKVLSNKIPYTNYLFKSLLLLIVSAIDASIFVVLRFAFLNFAFKFVFVSLLLSLILVAGTCFLLVLVDHILLPTSYKKITSAELQPTEEEHQTEVPTAESELKEDNSTSQTTDAED